MADKANSVFILVLYVAFCFSSNKVGLVVVVEQAMNEERTLHTTCVNIHNVCCYNFSYTEFGIKTLKVFSHLQQFDSS